MSDDEYCKIVDFLSNPGTKNHEILKRRVKRNNFKLVDFPKLGLKRVLCVPRKNVSKTLLKKYIYTFYNFPEWSICSSNRHVFFQEGMFLKQTQMFQGGL